MTQGLRCAGIYRLVLAATALCTSPAIAADFVQPEQALQIGNTALAMPVPEGLCLPSGALVGVAQAMAAADPSNVTLATYYQCGAEASAADHYVLVKVPRAALLAELPKDVILRELESAMTGPDAPKFDAAMEEKVSQGIGNVFGKAPDIEGNFGFAGTDGDCLYMAGRLKMNFPGIPDAPSGLVALCMTGAGNKMLTVNAYDFRPTGRISVLRDEARRIALSVHLP